MEYQVIKTAKRQCRIKLLPQTREEEHLLAAASDADMIEHYYHRAVKRKFGPVAHLLGTQHVRYPFEVDADFVREGE